MPALKNIKHEKFVQNLVKGLTNGEAYLKAGYDAKNADVASAAATRLLKDVRITARLAELTQRVADSAAEKISISKSWVLNKLVENVERSMQVRPVKKKVDGEEVDSGEFRYDGSVANKALELLGKELGMFIDRKEIKNVDEFDDMTVEELRELVSQEAEAILNDADAGTKH